MNTFFGLLLIPFNSFFWHTEIILGRLGFAEFWLDRLTGPYLEGTAQL